tara:strand:+ start:9233 stop:11431 length:2199 start_codon:yes stop_codon:yes gene_type:complete
MFKKLTGILLIFLAILFISISYLSIFGIKTNKFNELIKSQIVKQDNRIDIDLKDVFIKLKIKERSFAINAKDIRLHINDQSQKIKNIDIFLELRSFVTQNIKIKKIRINSQENEIKNLLKFIRTYKINIPALYLENSINKGDIIYNIIINFEDNNIKQTEINGKIIEAKFNVFSKEIINNISFDFNYTNEKLEILNLNFNYKKISFLSEKIFINKKNNLTNIKGSILNKVNTNLISNFFNYDLEKYFDKKILVSSKSDFNIILNNKLKIKKYDLSCELNLNDVQFNLKNTNLRNYISNFEDKIIFKDGLLKFKINNKNISNINLASKYILDKNQIPKDIYLSISKEKSKEIYNLKIDLMQQIVKLDDVDFIKKTNEGMMLNLNVIKIKNNFEIEDFKMFNNKNIFILKNVKLNKNFKVEDFKFIKAKFNNSYNFLNNFTITKINNNIELSSTSFDISKNIERSLKSFQKSNFFDIFQNLNSSIKMDIALVRIDKDHNLINVSGKTTIKNNMINKANIAGIFDEKNNFVYTKDQIDGKVVTTIYSDIAKPFVKKFSFIKGFEDGKLDFTSTEINRNLSRSELRIYDFKLQDMPALTKLLSLASLQGIADLATGEGIRFNEFEMFFDNSINLIKINEIYALGPAISILMEGYVEKNKLVSLRGTLVPATTINKTIAKIPLLGNILVGEKAGEGVFGVSFKIKGPPKNLDTRVNPIKTLTPRFITRTLDKLKKTN